MIDCLEFLFDGWLELIGILFDLIGDFFDEARHLWNETQPAVKPDSGKL